MSVRSGLMALLAEGEKYGAQLRSEFEARTGGTWPLNVGQVYTTLDRLVRDGLVESAGRAGCRGPHRLPAHARGPRRARRLVDHSRRPHQHPARRADHQAGPGRHRPGRRRAAGRADPAHRHPAAPPRPHPAQARVPRPHGGGRRGPCPGDAGARLGDRAEPPVRGQRPGLAARPGEPRLRGRGRGPLARPRRDDAGPPTRPPGIRPYLPRPAPPRPRREPAVVTSTNPGGALS